MMLVLPLVVTAGMTVAYLRTMVHYRAAVDDAATEVAGVLLRDVFDLVLAQSGRAALDLLREGVRTVEGRQGLEMPDEASVADALQRVADSLRTCACGGLPAVSVAAYTPTTGALAARGSRDTTVWRERLDGLSLTASARPGRLRTAAGRDESGPWFLYVLATEPEQRPPTIVLAEIDLDRLGPDLIAPAFTYAMKTHDLTRSLGAGGVALRVTHPDGRVLFDAGLPSDGPGYALPLFGSDLGSENVPGTQPLIARITVHPDHLPAIIPGGLPGSPWPLVAVSSITALLLTGTGVLLLWRLFRFTRARERFIATVSHELRTPLALILAYAETVGLERPAPESRRRAASVITRETRRMIQMVENALAFSQGQASTATLDLRDTDLVEAVREVVSDFRPLADDRQVRVSVVESGPVPVRVDGRSLRQVVNNLLDNAVRHGPVGQDVTISVKSRAGWGEVRVSDEGTGLPVGGSGRLWQPFVQAEEASSSGGAGLGLSIVRHFVELHDGEVAAENRPHGGAVFLVRFPLIQAA